MSAKHAPMVKADCRKRRCIPMKNGMTGICQMREILEKPLFKRKTITIIRLDMGGVLFEGRKRKFRRRIRIT